MPLFKHAVESQCHWNSIKVFSHQIPSRDDCPGVMSGRPGHMSRSPTLLGQGVMELCELTASMSFYKAKVAEAHRVINITLPAVSTVNSYD
jgi:hypothetical protein